MTVWSPPDGVFNRSSTITITASVSMFGASPYRCPAADAMKARGLRPHKWPRRKFESLEQFTFGPFMAELDRAERAGADGAQPTTPTGGEQPGRRVHDGVLSWTEHAVEMYRQAFPYDEVTPMIAVEHPWVYQYRLDIPDQRGAVLYRIKAWGRCLRSVDGTLRELRIPAHRLGRQKPTDAQRAAAALVVAEGTPDSRLERIRIVKVALSDGRTDVLFEGTRQAARELYREHGKSALSEVLDTQEYRPGGACVGCSYAAVCPALPKVPGLTGLDDESRPRRSWSATNGRSYQACPARDHMRRHGLPTKVAIERGPAAERGRAVHAYLSRRHREGWGTPCSARIPADWVPEGFTLPEEEQRLGAQLLSRHALVCPVRYASDVTDVRTEPRLVIDDPTADVVVIAEPDVLYRDGDWWVWREVKTSAGNRRWWRDPVRALPQLALAVLIIGHGQLGGSSSRARIELEVLRPGGADLETIDPFAPEVRATAEETLHGLVSDWHRDDLFAARPGPECARCEVSRWCPSYENRQAEQ